MSCCSCCDEPDSSYTTFQNEPVTTQPAPTQNYGAARSADSDQTDILKKNIQYLEIQLKKKEDEHTKRQSEIDKRQAESQNELTGLRKSNDDLKTRLAASQNESMNLKSSNDDLKTRLAVSQNELVDLRTANDDLRTRLSAAMSTQLTDENPNLADLSDLNRPTKLGELYSELYDNEWTDLYEKLTSECQMSGKEAILNIFYLFTAIYSMCHKKATGDLKQLEANIANFVAVGVQHKEIQKKLKDQRKRNYQDQVNKIRSDPDLMKEVNTIIQRSFSGTGQPFENFLQKSLTLCWLMSAQDPPVTLADFTNVHGKPFDTSLYKYYTTTGKYMDYVVWPAVHLHEEGVLLAKGTAQGMATAEASKDSTEKDATELTRKGSNSSSSSSETSDSD